MQKKIFVNAIERGKTRPRDRPILGFPPVRRHPARRIWLGNEFSLAYALWTVVAWCRIRQRSNFRERAPRTKSSSVFNQTRIAERISVSLRPTEITFPAVPPLFSRPIKTWCKSLCHSIKLVARTFPSPLKNEISSDREIENRFPRDTFEIEKYFLFENKPLGR